ncbi:MAG: c-type cytochrome, partial [Eudoraea sp.]|nr:c-type cytochrome [Eudoraea sp.]
FMLTGVPVEYQVNVKDPDGDGPVLTENLYVSLEYRESLDAVNQALGHQQLTAEVSGKALAQTMDCKTCHKEREASIGPTYLEIAEKYKDDSDVTSYIQNKIITGGSGVWGEVTMPAHPNISNEESRQLALYIQSLAGEGNRKESLPASGSIYPDPEQEDKVLVLTASYTDEGLQGAASLTGSNRITLQASTVPFTPNTINQGMTPFNFGGIDLLLVPAQESWFAFEDIDLTGIKVAYLMAGWQDAPLSGLDFEMRLGSPKGKMIGKGSMPKPVPGQAGGVIPIRLSAPMDVKVSELYFVYKPKEGEERGSGPIALMNVRFDTR